MNITTEQIKAFWLRMEERHNIKCDAIGEERLFFGCEAWEIDEYGHAIPFYLSCDGGKRYGIDITPEELSMTDEEFSAHLVVIAEVEAKRKEKERQELLEAKEKRERDEYLKLKEKFDN